LRLWFHEPKVLPPMMKLTGIQISQVIDPAGSIRNDTLGSWNLNTWLWSVLLSVQGGVQFSTFVIKPCSVSRFSWSHLLLAGIHTHSWVSGILFQLLIWNIYSPINKRITN
jgi:hypothetical protein